MSPRRPAPFDAGVTTVSLVENLGAASGGWLTRWTFTNPATVNDTTFPTNTLQVHDPDLDEWDDVGSYIDNVAGQIQVIMPTVGMPDAWRIVDDPTNVSFPAPLQIPESGAMS